MAIPNYINIHDKYVWRDHHPQTKKLSCSNLNLPNPKHPYKVVIHHWNGTLTSSIIRGLAEVNVTVLRIYDIDETTPLIELAKYTPHLTALEISARSRQPYNVANTFHHLRMLESLRIFNADLQFSRTVSPWVRTISHIHIENSSLSELPPWLAMSDNLHTLTVKNTKLHSISTVSQLRVLRSAKLSGNKIDDIGKHLLVSSDIYDIDLSRNKITSFAPHTFSLCTELRVLDLSHNPIEVLPHRPFSRNSKLKWLKLSGTQIKELLPENFVGLTSLKSLALSYSPLQSIAPFAFLPLKSLKTLDLEATNISAIPLAVTQNCGLTHLNVANNILHRRSSLPAEVIALLSGLTLLKLDGNPLSEFPPSLFILSTDNFRLIRQLVQTMTSLPVWIEEPCTPYYWAMHLRNRSLSFRNLVSTWNDKRMEKEGLQYCREQYEWMIEEMEIYRDLERNNGCSANRRLRSAALAQKTKANCQTNTKNNISIVERHTAVESRAEFTNILWASLMANIFLMCLILVFVCLILCCGRKRTY
ncbi:ELRR (Extracellular Leucine-Rich Repeat) ONly [Trichostrongylus colubriformis]|uniref:ELRR (Extracellular Leucine-Rich Repeat) ONly n=1 Tax=Trichostrongylus colubriformis TaxID=6319 RepID=A0AAN8G3S8_TRICO